MVPNDKDSVELDNYYTGEKITIPLNVALTPNQNAQRYFKKYQKLKEAVKHLTGLIEETKQTIDYLESVEFSLSQANMDEIGDIREELVQAGFMKRRSTDKRHKRKKPEQYLASDGKTTIMVGRNNLQNEELTFKMAKKVSSGSTPRIFQGVTWLSRTILTQLMRSRLMRLNWQPTTLRPVCQTWFKSI